MDDLAGLQDQHPVGQRDGFVDVVGHEQHTEAVLTPEVEQQRAHAQPGQRVERAERLVEQQQVRLGHQRTGQRNPLRLTTGQRQRPHLGAVGEADVGQRTVGAGLLLGLRQPAAGQPVDHIGAHVPPREQPRFLERQRRCAGHRTVAGVIGGQSGQHPKHRRLA